MILCDTNVIIEAFKKNPTVIQAMGKIGLDRIAVSVVTAMDLYCETPIPKVKRIGID